MAKYRMIRYLYRHVAVSKDLMIKLIDSIDADADGRITLSEVAMGVILLGEQRLRENRNP